MIWEDESFYVDSAYWDRVKRIYDQAQYMTFPIWREHPGDLREAPCLPDGTYVLTTLAPRRRATAADVAAHYTSES